MARVAQFVVSGLLAATMASGQSFDGTSRSEDAFSYVQPENTTILGPYGHSPAVLPSRMFLFDSSL
jgi:beta-glucosidase